MKQRRLGVGAVALCLLSSGRVTAEPGANKAPAQPENTRELIWPGAPLRPRIRYVGEISSAEDVKGKARRSWVQRLTGQPVLNAGLRPRKPYGITVGRSGRIYVADPAQRAILVYDLQGRMASAWRGSSQFPLFLPIGVALDHSGRLLVSDSFGGQVVVFAPQGKPVAAFGKGTFQRPGGIAVDDSRGRIYVVDVKLNQVLFFNLQSLALEKAIGGHSTGGAPEPGRFSGPTNIALDSKGNLYVVDTWNCRVQVFDADGKFLRMFGTRGTQPGRFVRPKGIAIDSEDHVYVVDAEFNNLQIFTAAGAPLMFVGTIGLGPGQFLLPAGLHIDVEDRIYVTEQRLAAGRIQMFQYLRERPGPAAAQPD